MKILSLRKDEAKIKVDTLDDLWHGVKTPGFHPICAVLDRKKEWA